MKKLSLLLVLLIAVVQFSNAQTEIAPDIAPELVEKYKTLAELKAGKLQTELSLNDKQTERVVAKIFKFSIIARGVLQSDLNLNKKTKELYAIAAEQNEEMQSILTEDQYNYYKRRNGAITSRR